MNSGPLSIATLDRPTTRMPRPIPRSIAARRSTARRYSTPGVRLPRLWLTSDLCGSFPTLTLVKTPRGGCRDFWHRRMRSGLRCFQAVSTSVTLRGCSESGRPRAGVEGFATAKCPGSLQFFRFVAYWISSLYGGVVIAWWMRSNGVVRASESG